MMTGMLCLAAVCQIGSRSGSSIFSRVPSALRAVSPRPLKIFRPIAPSLIACSSAGHLARRPVRPAGAVEIDVGKQPEPILIPAAADRLDQLPEAVAAAAGQIDHHPEVQGVHLLDHLLDVLRRDASVVVNVDHRELRARARDDRRPRPSTSAGSPRCSAAASPACRTGRRGIRSCRAGIPLPAESGACSCGPPGPPRPPRPPCGGCVPDGAPCVPEGGVCCATRPALTRSATPAAHASLDVPIQILHLARSEYGNDYGSAEEPWRKADAEVRPWSRRVCDAHILETHVNVIAGSCEEAKRPSHGNGAGREGPPRASV